MTVLDEHKDWENYYHIKFIEFLDFICRIALDCIMLNDIVQYKV